MFRTCRRSASAVLSAAAALLLTTAPAAAQSSAGDACAVTESEVTCIEQSVDLAGSPRDVVWYVPSVPASALMLVEHGFARSCAHLHGTAESIAARGLLVLCLDEDMTAGNPALAADLAESLAGRTLEPPDGVSLPDRYIVGGHSAGGHFAALVGAGLALRGYPDLAGAVLFDPVAAEGFSAALRTVSASGTRPVLSIAARPSLVNLFDNSFGALASLGAGFVGLQLLGGSCHVDAEGEDTDLIGIAGAGCVPDPVQTARLRDFAGTWAADLATGTRTASHYCADAATASTCGDAVRAVVSGTRPAAAVIPTS